MRRENQLSSCQFFFFSFPFFCFLLSSFFLTPLPLPLIHVCLQVDKWKRKGNGLEADLNTFLSLFYTSFITNSHLTTYPGRSVFGFTHINYTTDPKRESVTLLMTYSILLPFPLYPLSLLFPRPYFLFDFSTIATVLS